MVKHPIVKSSPLFSTFLSVSAEKDYEAKKKTMTKLPENIFATLKTLTGKSRAYLTPLVETSNRAVAQGVQDMKFYFKQLKALYTEFNVDLIKAANTAQRLCKVKNGIANTYGSLGEISMMNIFASLGEVFRKMATCFTNLNEITNNEINNYLKFYRHQLNSLDELINTAKNSKIQMDEHEKNLWKKKESLFLSKEVAKWQLDPQCEIPVDNLLHNQIIAFKEMLPKETLKISGYRILCSYYNNKVLEEFMRVSKKDSDEIINQCLVVSQKSAQVFKEVFNY